MGGAQDVYLTGNPQITFFKVVYRRHTNFSVETIEHAVDSAKPGGRYTVTVHRNGDLATNCALRVKLPALSQTDLGSSTTSVAWVTKLGHALIKQVEVEIGGSKIDKHVGTWLDIWHELTHTDSQESGYKKLIGDVPELTALRANASSGVVLPEYTLYVPFQFWFCRNTGLALPLIALQYHEVRFHIELEALNKLMVWVGTAPTLSGFSFASAGVMVDYVYIDTEERRRFAQVGHEYLINQLQFTGVEAVNSNPLRVKLGFNHPTKEFIWNIKSGDYISRNSPFLCYSNNDNWVPALTYAAENVISGSVTVGEAAPGPTPANAPEVNISSANYNEWNTVNPVSTNTRNPSKFTVFTYQAGQGVDDNLPPSDYAKLLYAQVNPGAANDSVNFKFRRDVLLNPQQLAYNLGDYVQKFAVIVYYTVVDANGVGKPGTLTYQVKPWEHTINVRDVSVPVAQWVDNRYTAKNGPNGYADMDVWAVLPTCSGLLINNKYNPVEAGVIQLNGHDRFDTREGAYFHLIQTYDYHSSTPQPGVNVYSFALHPEQHQPSGTCNLSRIDNTTIVLYLYSDVPFPDPSRNPPPLSVVGPSSEFYIYDTNYNVLRIMSGMGGLAYSN